jgi:CheY-like chemotaxis protein
VIIPVNGFNTGLVAYLLFGKGELDMDAKKIIRGKQILIVDDEKDVLDMLIELLEICKIDTAQSFEEGKRLLEENHYDVAILDIMGVKGFELLEVAKKEGTPALMLTAHALSEENLKKSAEEGASYYAPKDEMKNIDVFVADIIEAKEKKKNVWAKWYDRLGGFYDERFTGPNWREKEKEFWDKRLKQYSGL